MKHLYSLILLACAPLMAEAQQINLNKQQLLQDVQVLSDDSMEGRLTGSVGSKKAQDYIVNRFQEVGLQPYGDTYKQYFRLEAKKQYFKTHPRKMVVEQATNIVGYIPGEESADAIVIVAHYDHVGKKKDEIFNGADDNASGVGALLATAEYFKNNPPKHTMVFVALDGEELGFQGADAFLRNSPLPLENIILNVNLDMMSINDKGELFASGPYHYPFLKPYIEKIKARPAAKIRLGHDNPAEEHNDWTNQSDHYEFHKRSIPFVYFGVEDHDHYHKETDEFNQIDKTFFADAAELSLDFLKAMDDNLQNIKGLKGSTSLKK